MPDNTVFLPPDHEFTVGSLKIFKGASWFALGMASASLLEFAIQSLVAGRLGPSDFGVFSVGFQIYTFALTAALLALPGAVARFIPMYQGKGHLEKAAKVAATSAWLVLIASLFAGAALFSFASAIAGQVFHEPRLAVVIRILALCLPPSALVALLAGLLRGAKLSRDASLIQSTYERLLRLAFILFFFALGLGLKSPALAYLPASFLVCLLGWFILRRSHILTKAFKPALATSKELFHYTWPLMLSQLFSQGRVAIQPLMLAYFLSAKDAGIYAIALFISESFSRVLTAFNFLYLPVISGISLKANVDLVRRLYRLVTGWSFILIWPVCLLVILFPGTFLSLFGTQYQAGAWALRLLVIASVINVGVGAVGTTLLAAGLTRLYLLIDLAGTLASFGVSLWLIPRLGLPGAAFAHLLMIAVWNGLALLAVYITCRIQPFSRCYLYVFAASLICLLPFYPLVRWAVNLTPWAILGVIPILTCLTVYVLLKFRLLDGDSLAVFAAFQIELRGQVGALHASLSRAIRHYRTLTR